MKKLKPAEVDLQKQMKDIILDGLANPLSSEQVLFIDLALQNKNVLVDACIGSGKTTVVQTLCDIMLDTNKILYLTFNKLLKADAQKKILNDNVLVQNYHGFVYPYLRNAGISCSIGESMRAFIDLDPKVKKYDVLILDEYQDITEEYAQVLRIIKASNPNIQILAVGDMAQKIYDHTRLDVVQFIKEFMGDYEQVQFTNCFRLGKKLAGQLANAWDKSIVGVNKKQKVHYMTKDQVIEFLLTKDPSEIIALGKRQSMSTKVLDELSYRDPKKFNKYTVFSSLGTSDQNVQPTDEVAIFTTYDASKGMERSICVVFDFNEDYWEVRSTMPDANREIIKNIFLVAASRGKDDIIFVQSYKEEKRRKRADELGYLDISGEPKDQVGYINIESFHFDDDDTKNKNNKYTNISMFDFKYVEDVQKTFDLLEISPVVSHDTSEIEIDTQDGFLDLSPAISMYALAAYFKDLDVKSRLGWLLQNLENEESKEDILWRLRYYTEALNWQLSTEYNGYYEDIQKTPEKFHIPRLRDHYETEFNHDKDDIQWQLLVYMTALTKYNAYIQQVFKRYISKTQQTRLIERMASRISEHSLHNIEGAITNRDKSLTIRTLADVIEDDTVYNIRYTDSLSYIDYLRCAVDMIIFNRPYGRVWNLFNNECYEICIPDRKAFMDNVVVTITKGRCHSFVGDIM